MTSNNARINKLIDRLIDLININKLCTIIYMKNFIPNILIKNNQKFLTKNFGQIKTRIKYCFPY